MKCGLVNGKLYDSMQLRTQHKSHQVHTFRERLQRDHPALQIVSLSNISESRRLTLNSTTLDPTFSTTPAISSPWFSPFLALSIISRLLSPEAAISGTFQSFGLDPDTTTLMSTWSSFGTGIGLSTNFTVGPAKLMTSFMSLSLFLVPVKRKI